MGLVCDNEQTNRPLNHSPTKSAAQLFRELLENVNTNISSSSIRTLEKGKSPLSPNEASNATPLPPQMETPTFTPKSKHTSSNLSQRILEGFQSQYQAHEPSPPPTNSRSHPHPHPPNSHPRSHPRHRSSRSSETISAMLLIATERLSQETSRANEAERQSSEILAHFKITNQAKQRLEVDLQRVKDELGLYKTQLNIAQAEIRRAQEVVDSVDRQRADAEDEARRGREKVRKLTEERSMELAMEEGRRLGYEEGIRQGRLMMQARDNDINQQPRRYYRRTSFRSDDDQVSYFSYTQEERHSAEPSRSPTNPSTSLHPSSRQRRMSDAKHPAPPISPTSTSRPISNHGHSSSSTPKPENIAIQSHPKDSNPTIPIRPISIRNHSPTISHRSFKIPPDGYIPTVGVDSFISLPPPHELSMPIPPAGPSQPSATRKPTPAAVTSSDSNQAGKKASTSRSFEYADRESRRRSPTSVGGEITSNHTLSRQPHINNNRNNPPNHKGPRSESSGASTYISESSLLGPPDDVRRNENRGEEGTRRVQSQSRASTQSERMAGKARCVNADMTRSPSPPLPRSNFLDQYNESTSRMQGNFVIERPRSTDPSRRPQPRPPRRTREIVLPTPLALPSPTIVQKLDLTAQETAGQWQSGNDRPSSQDYYDERPPLSVSNITVPGIEIVTPSSHTGSTRSGRTVIDPVLLTPESANRPLIPLPVDSAQSTTNAPPNPGSSLGLYSISGGINMTLPDNNLPPGFIPLSPIPGMTNLDSYPSGFAPSVSKLQDEYPGGQLPSNFSYPSSPLIRSVV